MCVRRLDGLEEVSERGVNKVEVENESCVIGPQKLANGVDFAEEG